LSDAATKPKAQQAEIPYNPRNFWAWVAYQFFFRIGWQFKMESTMMAGLISYLAPSPFLMGLFTTLNTLGRNLSPLFAAPVVDRNPRKKTPFWVFWGITVVSWAGLTVYLWSPSAENSKIAIWVFGACYTMFFVFLGSAGVAQGALLGKIIPAGMRGRAMAMGMTLSGVINVVAIYVVYSLVKGGSFPEPKNYALAFTFTTLFFTCAAVSLLFVNEEPSRSPKRDYGIAASLKHFRRLARENENLARLMVVNVCVGILGSMLQFYTRFRRHNGTITESELIIATDFQVLWHSMDSSILGRVADKHGNRHVICWLMWMDGAIPLLAWLLGGVAPFKGHWEWYLGVYTVVGLRFPLYQLLVNYLLEVVPQQEHAMALGAINTVQLVTAPAPLVLGLLAKAFGYPAAFLASGAVGAYGAFCALKLQEVRVVRAAVGEVRRAGGDRQI
jgi:MFS family permease